MGYQLRGCLLWLELAQLLKLALLASLFQVLEHNVSHFPPRKLNVYSKGITNGFVEANNIFIDQIELKRPSLPQSQNHRIHFH